MLTLDHPQVRAYLEHHTQEPGDRGALAGFVDWLQEQGARLSVEDVEQPEELAYVGKGAPQGQRRGIEIRHAVERAVGAQFDVQGGEVLGLQFRTHGLEPGGPVRPGGQPLCAQLGGGGDKLGIGSRASRLEMEAIVGEVSPLPEAGRAPVHQDRVRVLVHRVGEH